MYSAADGTEVRACQVVAAPIPGKSFAVVDHSGLLCPIFSDSACARALNLRPDTVLHYAAAMTPQIELAVAQCSSAVHVGVWGAAVEMSSMCAGKSCARMRAATRRRCLSTFFRPLRAQDVVSTHVSHSRRPISSQYRAAARSASSCSARRYVRCRAPIQVRLAGAKTSEHVLCKSNSRCGCAATLSDRQARGTHAGCFSI